MPSSRAELSKGWPSALSCIIDGCNRAIGRLVSWLTALMAVTLGSIVLLARFDTGFVWLQELVIYLHAMAFMTAAAYTLLNDGHVRIDLLYSRMSVRGQALVNALGVLFLLLPSCAVILHYSASYVLGSWQIMEGSPEAGGIPASFLLKSFIWVYAILMSLQGISLLIRNIGVIFGPTNLPTANPDNAE